MATLKQTRANRLNAQKCTGPSSAEGKARSSMNALKSGIHAESEVLPWEDPAKRATLAAEWTQHHHPCTPEERTLVDSLAHAESLFRRFREAEVKIILSKIPDGADLTNPAVIGQAYADASPELGRLQRRMDATNRNFHRDLDALCLLQAGRPPLEDPPPPLILVPNPPDPPPAETEAPADLDPPAPPPDPAAGAPPAAASPDPPAPAVETAAPDTGPPAPSPAPAAEAAPTTPPDPSAPAAEPAPPAPAPVVVLVGLNRILSELSKNLTPSQLATSTLREAAALRNSTGPQPADPDLSTPQTTEPTAQTQQMDSFGKKPETAPAPAPEKPRGFNPNNPHHPPIETCAWCTSKGRIQDRCHFWPRGWPRE